MVNQTSTLQVAKCNWYFLRLNLFNFWAALNTVECSVLLDALIFFVLGYYTLLILFLVLWFFLCSQLSHPSWFSDHTGVYHSSVLVYPLSLYRLLLWWHQQNAFLLSPNSGKIRAHIQQEMKSLLWYCSNSVSYPVYPRSLFFFLIFGYFTFSPWKLVPRKDTMS